VQAQARIVNIRRLLFDVDKALARPSLLEIAEAVNGCGGVKALNIAVGDVDTETLDMNITIEGEKLDYSQIVKAIEHTGAVVHNLEQIAAGDHIVEPLKRTR
jgi:hypothetical protein